jgi:hypothetical protein
MDMGARIGTLTTTNGIEGFDGDIKLSSGFCHESLLEWFINVDCFLIENYLIFLFCCITSAIPNFAHL